MKHSNSTSAGAAEVPEDGVQRVYRDTTRAAIYDEYVWKVEYAPDYAHADRWFTTLQEATEYAQEQENLRSSTRSSDKPPAGFKQAAAIHEGPGRHCEDNNIGVSSWWTPAEGVVFHVNARTDLNRAEAEALHELLGSILQEVQP